MEEAHKIILLVDLSESYGRNLIRGINRFSDTHRPASFCKMPPFFRETYGMEGILNFAREWEADGIIGQFYNTDEINKLIRAGLYIIAVDFREKFSQIPNISGAYRKSGEMAAEYFLSKGHKNFGFYGFHQTVWSREREEGFTTALLKKGHKTSVFTPEAVSSHNFWYYQPSPLQDWLLSLKKPVAIFACDDNRNEHLVEAAKLANLHIPEEIALLGVDNDEIICQYTNPPLSSIQQDEENAGFKAASLMDRMIREKRLIRENIHVEPLRVVTRQSTDMLAVEDEYIRKALIYIHNNLENEIYVNDVAQEVFLSRRALEKRFLKATGRTVYQEIQQKRIEKVVRLLLESNLSIQDIAIKCGYQDSKNLSRIFSSIHNISPSQYRKKYLFQG